MSIEACEFLRPSLKAKLQDGGILHMHDLRECLKDRALGQSQGLYSSIMTSSSVSAVIVRGGTSDSAIDRHQTLRHALREKLAASFTDSELDDLAAALSAYDGGDALVGGSLGFTIKSLAQLQQEEETSRRNGCSRTVTTFCRSLDGLLGGGVPVGSLTEVSGPPGVGKTQLLQQLAVSCALPIELGGLGGECLYIDTEGSFVPERFHQIVSAAVAKVREIALRVIPSQNTSTSDAERLPPPAKKTEGSRKTGDRVRPTSRSSAARSASPTPSLPRRKRKRSDGSVKSESPSTSQQLFPSPCPSMRTGSCTPPPPEQRGENPKLEAGEKLAATVPPPPSTSAAVVVDLASLAKMFTVDYVLKRVHYVRVTDLASLMAIFYSLPAFLESKPVRAAGCKKEDHTGSSPLTSRIKMVVIDSIAFPFRSLASEDENVQVTSGVGQSNQSRSKKMWQRSRLLFSCSQQLQSYAALYNLAVVVSNQVTSKSVFLPPDVKHHSTLASSSSSRGNNGMLNSSVLSSFSSSSYPQQRQQQPPTQQQRTTILVPALSDSWAYGVSTRLLLSYYHYALPASRCKRYCSTQSDQKLPSADVSNMPTPVVCRENVALFLSHVQHMSPEDVCSGGGGENDNSVEPSTELIGSVSQHRVARLLKSTVSERGECCFAITRKGIRDVVAVQRNT